MRALKRHHAVTVSLIAGLLMLPTVSGAAVSNVNCTANHPEAIEARAAPHRMNPVTSLLSRCGVGSLISSAGFSSFNLGSMLNNMLNRAACGMVQNTLSQPIQNANQVIGAGNARINQVNSATGTLQSGNVGPVQGMPNGNVINARPGTQPLNGAANGAGGRGTTYDNFFR